MTPGSRSVYIRGSLRSDRIRFGLQSTMEIIGFLMLVVVAIGSVKGRVAGDQPCLCTLEFNEVCGTDGVTYSNPCVAACSGAGVRHTGKCENIQWSAIEKKRHSTDERICPCQLILSPVCGSDGRTYPNQCVATCNDVGVIHDGECKNAIEKKQHSTDERICPCQTIYRPVCGSDGKTYSNQCLATCNDASVIHDGECKNAIEKKQHSTDECPCPRNYDPVCGEDGRTYHNQCLAECNNVRIVNDDGPC